MGDKNEAACAVVPMRSSGISPGQGVNESQSSVNFQNFLKCGVINESQSEVNVRNHLSVIIRIFMKSPS